MPTTLLMALSIFLWVIGLAIVLTKQHAIFILIGIELMTNGAHLHTLVFSAVSPAPLQGHVLVLFSMVILVCEIALGLAIILQVYRHYQTPTLPSLKPPA